jgi:putative transposase
MTDVTEDRDQAGAELSAADEQLLRELTERARAGGLKLTGEGGLLGRLILQSRFSAVWRCCRSA